MRPTSTDVFTAHWDGEEMEVRFISIAEDQEELNEIKKKIWLVVVVLF